MPVIEEKRRAATAELDRVAEALDDVILYTTQAQNALVHVREQLSVTTPPTTTQARDTLGDLNLCAKELSEAVEDLQTSIASAEKAVGK
jgi:hypothetical protein